MAELIPISTRIAAAAPDPSAKKGRKQLERRESVSDIMLTPLLVLILVFLFSAVSSALAGS